MNLCNSQIKIAYKNINTARRNRLKKLWKNGGRTDKKPEYASTRSEVKLSIAIFTVRGDYF
jgi:hypothetical protein